MRPEVLAGLAALLIAQPAAAQEAGLEGRWRTTAGEGVVEIRRCGAAWCGRLVGAAALRRNPAQADVNNRNASLRGRPLQGLVVLRDLTGGPQVWRGGPFYDPHSGQTADTGSVTVVDPDTLSVRGCIARVLCRTQTWRRAG